MLGQAAAQVLSSRAMSRTGSLGGSWGCTHMGQAYRVSCVEDLSERGARALARFHEG